MIRVVPKSCALGVVVGLGSLSSTGPGAGDGPMAAGAVVRGAQPHLGRARSSLVMLQIVFFFLLPLPFQKQTHRRAEKKRNFFTCGQLRKEKLLLRECWGWCCEERHCCSHGSLRHILTLRGGTMGPGDVGPGLLLLLLTTPAVWHGRSNSIPKPFGASMSLWGSFGMW